MEKHDKGKYFENTFKSCKVSEALHCCCRGGAGSPVGGEGEQNGDETGPLSPRSDSTIIEKDNGENEWL